jgi:acetyl/propionyl-CoA carboxylase alpha subunit
MAWEVAPGKEAEGEMSMHSAAGPAMPGDYVALVIYGITEVKVASGANIAAGDRLTVAEAGQVRALQTRTVEGMVVTEGAQVVGIALATPVAGQETIPVFVTLR